MSAEKDAQKSINPEKRPVILLDVAGTTTSNNFIQDTLFPYVKTHIEEYFKTNWDEENVKTFAKQLVGDGGELTVEKAFASYKTISEKDENNKVVKELQGLIYEKGYEGGSLKAHIFPDVPEAIETWSKTRCIAIYSSGSVESQKLLFAHTTEGDLSKHISHYFDLSVGNKCESSSYTKIAETLSVRPEDVIFINDNIEEANAAKKSGATAVIIKREGNKEISEKDASCFTVLSSFSDLPIEAAGKRKNEEQEDVTEAPPAKIAKTETENDNKTPAQEIASAAAMEVDSIEGAKDGAKQEVVAKDLAIVDDDVEMTDDTKNEGDKAVVKSMEKIQEQIKETKDFADGKSGVIEGVAKTVDVSKNEGKDAEKETKSSDAVDRMETEEKVVEKIKEPTEEKLVDKLEEKSSEKNSEQKGMVAERDETKGKATGGNADHPKEVAENPDHSNEDAVKSDAQTQVNDLKDATKTVEKDVGKDKIKKDEVTKSKKKIENEAPKTEKIKNDTGPSQNENKMTNIEETNKDEEKPKKDEEKPKKDEKPKKANTDTKVAVAETSSKNNTLKEEKTQDKNSNKMEIESNRTGTVSEAKTEKIANTNEDKTMDMEIEITKTNAVQKMETPHLTDDTKKETTASSQKEKESTDKDKTDKTSVENNVTNMDTETTKSVETESKEPKVVEKNADLNAVDDSNGDENETEASNDINMEIESGKTKSVQNETVCTNKEDVNMETESEITETKNVKIQAQKETETKDAQKAMETKDAQKETEAKETEIKGAQNNKTETSESVKETKDKTSNIEVRSVESTEIKNSSETPEQTKTTEKIESEQPPEASNENLNGEASTSEEKENQSDLANGTSSVENGSDDVKNNGEVETNTKEDEIKVKKLEEKQDSTPVSVEA